MKIRRTELRHDIRFVDRINGVAVSSFATVNIDPNKYLSMKELKNRANTLAYAQYKKEKREFARHAAQKKILWIMSIVKCKVFVNKLKKKWMETKARKEQEAKEAANLGLQRLGNNVDLAGKRKNDGSLLNITQGMF